MLAGCSSSSLLSSMSTQRLDLPSSFPRRDASRSQPIRPVGISVDKPGDSKTTSFSLRRSFRPTPSATAPKDEFREKGKSLKRFAEQEPVNDEPCISRAKRKRDTTEDDDLLGGGGEGLRLGQLNSGDIWSIPHVLHPISCSGEEARACFVPSGRPAKEASGSSPSSETHSLGIRPIENTLELEIGYESRNQAHQEIDTLHAGEEDDDRSFELVSLLVACVEAIGSKNVPSINHLLAALGGLASPMGPPTSRLIAYFTEALALRVARLWPHIFKITVPREIDRADDDGGVAFGLLNQVSPIPKFIHFTANEILLRAFNGKERVHIVDLDIKQGLQWPSLFQSLASRASPPSHVRITGIGASKQELNDTGDRLSGFAEELNLPFEFHPVVDRLEDVRLWMLHVKERETVAVNCVFQLHKTLHDPNRGMGGRGGAFKDFLGLIHSTNPAIVLMAEQEARHNEPDLEARVCSSLKYYSAIFDSFDFCLPLDTTVRIKLEEMYAREIRNIVTCEGRERCERHESFAVWRRLMEEGGFRCAGISEAETQQSRMLLKMYECENYKVKEQGPDDALALTLSWLDQPLYTVSAWTPLGLAGSSSTFPWPD